MSADKQQLLNEFIRMYGRRAKGPIDAYKAGGDPRPVLMADVTPRGIVPDMRLESLTVEQAAAKLDTFVVTVKLFLAQVERIVSAQLAGEQCAMCPRFPGGEVLSEVVKLRPVKR